MAAEHHYTTVITWTGNKGTGTSGYQAYERAHTIQIDGKPDILGSSDAPFCGDTTRHNPEDMLIASLSTCHMLWYLHLCADAGVIVTDYTDRTTGVMVQVAGGGGHFQEVTLHPVVTVADESMIERAHNLHKMAHEKCFIANSVNFPVKQEPEVKISAV
jgi:organic hydroperoxide reductase OsmC/OhrA